MLSAWIGLIAEIHLNTPLDEITICSTAQDDFIPPACIINGHTIKRVGRGVGFKALGCWITFDGKCDLEVDRRLDAAWATFWKYKHVFCSQYVPLSKRISLLDKYVKPAILWCTGTLNLRGRQHRLFRATHSDMVRKMVKFSRKPGQTDDWFFATTATKIGHWISAGSETWDKAVFRSYYRWAGWMSRLRRHDPDRLTYAIFNWRNLASLRLHASKNKGHQGHDFHFKVWRWEQTIDRLVGRDWEKTAWDPELWSIGENVFVKNRDADIK